MGKPTTATAADKDATFRCLAMDHPVPLVAGLQVHKDSVFWRLGGRILKNRPRLWQKLHYWHKESVMPFMLNNHRWKQHAPNVWMENQNRHVWRTHVQSVQSLAIGMRHSISQKMWFSFKRPAVATQLKLLNPTSFHFVVHCKMTWNSCSCDSKEFFQQGSFTRSASGCACAYLCAPLPMAFNVGRTVCAHTIMSVQYGTKDFENTVHDGVIPTRRRVQHHDSLLIRVCKDRFVMEKHENQKAASHAHHHFSFYQTLVKFLQQSPCGQNAMTLWTLNYDTKWIIVTSCFKRNPWR